MREPTATAWRNERRELLRAHAGEFARAALDNVVREFPHHEAHLQTAEEPVAPRPRVRHPSFYGSYDWHSCVEMFWVLVRLPRVAPELVPVAEIGAVLDAHLTPEALAVEAEYFARDDQGTTQRPYGWSALLELADEAAASDAPDDRRRAAALDRLADGFATRYLDWLPRADYPVRHGVHTNSAFGLSRALPYARRRAAAGDPRLRDAIGEAALRWFGRDEDYPGDWEPSGQDFLSPALVEADLMAALLPPGEFADWLSRFLPGLAEGRPAALFTPVTVSDATDAQIGHLHGVNLNRAWCWQRLADALPADDPRVPTMIAAARDHTHASLPATTSGPYTTEHWLAYYALLLLA
ncbi:DUF2891 domain-containing protein [Streptomyces sp. B6B3]|uniref:DUF2891 domain-containing protein n=1 Tax=Streptomyces sp. B6B3 TaxID=3153570 RepID=UPI00325EBA4B